MDKSRLNESRDKITLANPSQSLHQASFSLARAPSLSPCVRAGACACAVRVRVHGFVCHTSVYHTGTEQSLADTQVQVQVSPTVRSPPQSTPRDEDVDASMTATKRRINIKELNPLPGGERRIDIKELV